MVRSAFASRVLPTGTDWFAQMYPASRESAAFGDQAMMRIRAYRFHLLGAVSWETSFPARIYSTPIDRCAISMPPPQT